MSSILSHLLAHHLAQNSQVPSALTFIKQVINQDRAIHRALQQEGVDGPVVHRYVHFRPWHLRSDMCSSQEEAARLVGSTESGSAWPRSQMATWSGSLFRVSHAQSKHPADDSIVLPLL